MGILLVFILGVGNLFSKEKDEKVNVEPPWKEVRGELRFENTPNPILIKNAKIFQGEGLFIERGWILLKDRLIHSVGKGDFTSNIEDNFLVFDIEGKYITPGMIDIHSHMGVYANPGAPAHSDGNEMVNPITAGIETIHAFWPQDIAIERAVAGGTTTIQVLPGSANLIGGHGATLKLHPRLTPQDMRFPGAKDGLKMACGENPKRVYGDRGGPQTRMGNLYRDRQAWINAVEYSRGWKKWEKEWGEWAERQRGEEPDPPSRDLTMETMMMLMDGDILAQVHCYRADDLLHMLNLSHEFNWHLRVFHHAIESYKIRDVLAKNNTGVGIWADWWGFKYEAYDATIAGPGLSHLEGVNVIIHSDSAIDIQRLNQRAAQIYYEAIEKGLDIREEEAIDWFTYNAAWGLDIHEKTGSLKPGKMADLVIWSHHPFSIKAVSETTIIDGQIMWDRSKGISGWSDFETGQWTFDRSLE